MSCVNGFGRALVFAFLIAAACPFYLGLAEIALGWRLAFASYLLFAAPPYLLAIARRPLAGVTAATCVGASGTGLLLFGGSISELALLLGVLIGFFRSALLYRDPHADAGGFARAFAREALLIGAGLGLAGYLLRGAPFPEASALWGFFLVQSAFFLSARAGRSRATSAPPEIDPFERAQRRAREILQQSPSL